MPDIIGIALVHADIHPHVHTHTYTHNFLTYLSLMKTPDVTISVQSNGIKYAIAIGTESNIAENK